jgi:hypothetical protein
MRSWSRLITRLVFISSITFVSSSKQCPESPPKTTILLPTMAAACCLHPKKCDTMIGNIDEEESAQINICYKQTNLHQNGVLVYHPLLTVLPNSLSSQKHAHSDQMYQTSSAKQGHRHGHSLRLSLDLLPRQSPWSNKLKIHWHDGITGQMQYSWSRRSHIGVT